MNTKLFKYILGFILLGIILAAFALSKIALFIVSVFFIILAMCEYRNMFGQINIKPHPILPELVGSICAFVFASSNITIEQTIIIPVLLTGTVFSFILTVILNKKPYIYTSFSTVLAILFILCGLYIIKLTYYFDKAASIYLILVYFAAVLAGDFAASLIGPKYKKLLLAPEISPNKTVLGAITNLVTSCLICLLLKPFMNMNIINCVILGTVISIFSQFGDLTVSTLKREIGIKHSGNMFLNYGGVLDRMDAFIFSAPAAYYFLYIIAKFTF